MPVFKRKRPSLNRLIKLRVPLDSDILEAFISTGEGWQSRMNSALKEWISAHPLNKSIT